MKHANTVAIVTDAAQGLGLACAGRLHAEGAGQAAAKAMMAQGRGGAIVNMSSINAILANPRAVAYAVSKGGIKQ